MTAWRKTDPETDSKQVVNKVSMLPFIKVSIVTCTVPTHNNKQIKFGPSICKSTLYALTLLIQTVYNSWLSPITTIFVWNITLSLLTFYYKENKKCPTYLTPLWKLLYGWELLSKRQIFKMHKRHTFRHGVWNWATEKLTWRLCLAVEHQLLLYKTLSHSLSHCLSPSPPVHVMT